MTQKASPAQFYNRRTFLEFLGKGVIGSAVIPPLLAGCDTPPTSNTTTIEGSKFGLKPMRTDQVELMKGLQHQVLIKWGDPISAQDQFGFNNDYLAFLPLDKNNPNDGLLWANHEYIDPRWINDQWMRGSKTPEQLAKERYNVGGSLIRVQKSASGEWRVIQDDPHNCRFHADTEIPFLWDEKIADAAVAIGTMANCSGGITPWGTILTCEENYDLFYPSPEYHMASLPPSIFNLDWEQYYEHPSEHYGWVVEVDPKTKKGQKLVALGRCAHECATMHTLADGRVVVYSGDDANDQCLYKFISAKAGSLKEGTLYVANTGTGKWISLAIEDQPILRENFTNQTDVLVHLRKAAHLVGGTPLDRPEDIEIDPLTGHIVIALTNSIPKGNFYGSILKIMEENNDHASLNFQSDTYLAGGRETGFACPDNLLFDKTGNLWFTTDMSGSKMGLGPYEGFGNNSLFVMLRTGPHAGEVVRVANAPFDAEFTGPYLSPDESTLFLSVQHPGEMSLSPQDITSHWPDGAPNNPRPAVITIQGEGLQKIIRGDVST